MTDSSLRRAHRSALGSHDEHAILGAREEVGNPKKGIRMIEVLDDLRGDDDVERAEQSGRNGFRILEISCVPIGCRITQTIDLDLWEGKVDTRQSNRGKHRANLAEQFP